MSSRIRPQQVPDTYLAQVQANFNAVDVLELNGGLVQQVVAFVSGVGLINWPFRFTVLSGTGTSKPFKLTVPLLTNYPVQDLGYFIHGSVLTPAVLNTGVISATLVLTQGVPLTLKGMLTTVSV